MSKQMFSVLFSKSAPIYTEIESFTHYVDDIYEHNNNT